MGNNPRTINKLKFEFFPAYADFILRNKLDEFIKMSLAYSREEELSLMKQLDSSYTEEQLIWIGKAGITELLNAIVNNDTKSYLDDAIEKWTKNQLPVIDKGQIAADDIMVGAFIRRKLFRSMLQEFTRDKELMMNIMEEVDRFTTQAELLSYNAYIEFQQEKLKNINAELSNRETQLMEALTKKRKIMNELNDLNISLSHKNSELENTNKELESFNYIASHDLQEPLRKIQTFSSRVIDQADILPKTTIEYIEKINESSLRMQNLIEDLLSFSQITGLAEAFEDVDLNIILNEAKQILSIEKQDLVEAVYLPTINAVPFQFAQLFSNLIGNSIKYKKDNVPPRIQISHKIVNALNIKSINEQDNLKGNYLQISFKDNGIGFEPEYNEKIFDLFKRLHSKEKYSGTGIGLSICKKIVHNHNGFIEAESTNGNGASFHIYLPAERVI